MAKCRNDFLLGIDLTSGVLVCGGKHRNRATHGDVVAVELLPKSEWRGKATALSEGQAEERSSEGSGTTPTGETPRQEPVLDHTGRFDFTPPLSPPAGRVVGVLQRSWRDYVVTFPARDASQSQGRNSQRILAVPWDRRIPKIRISTQQADVLQVRSAPL